MKLRFLFALALTTLILASCSTPKDTVYFQDTVDRALTDLAKQEDIRFKPGDKFLILVNSKDQALTSLFNLPYINRQIGTVYTSGASQGVAGYTVDKEGDISFPVLGTIHVADLTREEVAKKIQYLLQSENLVNDAVVTVEYQNLSVSVVGEVTRPGKYAIDRDNVTVLDAIGMAGDLTIFGERTNVKVLRNEEGVQRTYVLDLTSSDSTFGSPAFYLQQNDVVYVEPNGTKIRQSTVNGNNVRSTSFWISIASLLVSIAVLIKK